MNSFYVNLQAELADAKEELWAQTRIDGAEAGKKILLKGEPKDTDSVFVDEKGERIFQERISRPAKLVICGAGHVSMPIIRMGKMLGFHVTVVEDRPKFADDARRAEADQVYCLKMVLQRSKEIQIHGLLLLQEVTDMTQIVSEQSLESQELMLE